MATSHTKRKRSRNRGRARPLLDNPQVDHVLTTAVKFLHTWTQRELVKLANVGQVVIVPGKNKNSYGIGKYQMLRSGDYCWTVMLNDTLVQNFFDRRSAVLYCMNTQNTFSRRAEELRMQDAEVAKLWQNNQFYQHTLQSARKNKNWVLHDVMQARIAEISSKLENAQDLLEKSLRWAKYNKTQDGSHETTRIRN